MPSSPHEDASVPSGEQDTDIPKVGMEVDETPKPQEVVIVDCSSSEDPSEGKKVIMVDSSSDEENKRVLMIVLLNSKNFL